ncbi:MAG: hypothetical protein ACRDHC_05165 [Actinomycetota bacterium]
MLRRVLSPLLALVAVSQTGDAATASPTPSPPGAGDALGTGVGVLIAVALLGLLLWSRRRLEP